MRSFFAGISVCVLSLGLIAPLLVGDSRPKRNVIIFVADGLRNGAVNETDTPTLYRIRKEGVYFQNSHSLFPTFTTANASAIATGHYLGDTGDFSNTIFVGYPLFNTNNFGHVSSTAASTIGTAIPFLEDDQRLGDLDSHFNGSYLNEFTLMALARRNGYNTAAIGKGGPAAIQDIEELRPVEHEFRMPQGVVLDDFTGKENPAGHKAAPPLPEDIESALHVANMQAVTPDRSNGCAADQQCNNGNSGNNQRPGTSSANTAQQQFFVDATTKAILPTFVASGKPFVLLYWSRDPDGTQHNQGDSMNRLAPGINGPTVKLALKNADDNLKQILAYIGGNPQLKANTDIFITSDHGFATISRHEIDAGLHATQSYSAQFKYSGAGNALEIPQGYVPSGFLGIDLAHALHMKLYDPDRPALNGSAVSFPEVDPASPGKEQRPSGGDAFIGNGVHMADGSDAKIIVAANGGADLIYVPDYDAERVREIVEFLGTQDYVGGIFVDTDRYGEIPGALSLRSINLIGATPLPVPAVAVSFKSFYLEPGNPLSAIQVSDTTLQEGQGMHGGFGRECTFNNMAAIGPDFKAAYTDISPVSNVDIAVTLAHILGFTRPSRGVLQGRSILEAIKGGPVSMPSSSKTIASAEANGRETILHYQELGVWQYFDQACFVAVSGKSSACPK